MSKKNSNDTIGNGTRDLPTYSAAPQRTALRRGPVSGEVERITTSNIYNNKNSMECYTSSNSGFQARL
jgi:hypothetical protein